MFTETKFTSKDKRISIEFETKHKKLEVCGKICIEENDDGDVFITVTSENDSSEFIKVAMEKGMSTYSLKDFERMLR